MKLRFATIASGSSGNCIYVGTESTNILIDAGLSGVKIERGLKSLNLDAAAIDAVFVTHEHIDHVNGVGVLSRKFDLPVYATEGTWNAMPEKVGKISKFLKNNVYEDEPLVLNDMCIKPFEIPHDAAQPVGYTVSVGKYKVSVATDMGHATKTVAQNIAGSDVLLIESNHDVDMVKQGAYPYNLKKRILGDRGHLSNMTAAKMIDYVADSKLKYVLLGHLRKDNNTPELAYETCADMLTKSGAVIGGDFEMWVAPCEGVGRCIEL